MPAAIIKRKSQIQSTALDSHDILFIEIILIGISLSRPDFLYHALFTGFFHEDFIAFFKSGGLLHDHALHEGCITMSAIPSP